MKNVTNPKEALGGMLSPSCAFFWAVHGEKKVGPPAGIAIPTINKIL